MRKRVDPFDPCGPSYAFAQGTFFSRQDGQLILNAISKGFLDGLGLTCGVSRKGR